RRGNLSDPGSYGQIQASLDVFKKFFDTKVIRGYVSGEYERTHGLNPASTHDYERDRSGDEARRAKRLYDHIEMQLKFAMSKAQRSQSATAATAPASTVGKSTALIRYSPNSAVPQSYDGIAKALSLPPRTMATIQTRFPYASAATVAEAGYLA